MQLKAWILCPVCGSKTRLKIREDTVLENFPLYCPKCKQTLRRRANKFASNRRLLALLFIDCRMKGKSDGIEI